jgi:hypothetical protein
MPGARNFWLIRFSGEGSFIVVGEWDSMEVPLRVPR